MADTTTTTVTELIQASIGQARVVVSQGASLTDTVTNRPLEEGKGSATFPIWDEEVMAAVAEGTDLTATAFDTTDVEITPGEKGLMTNLTRLAKRRSGMQTAIDIGNVMGAAYKAKRNADIYALFDGFSQALGTTNVNITEALILEAIALLEAAKAPKPYFLPVTPYVKADLMGLYSSNTDSIAASLMENVQVNGVLPMIHGIIPVLVDDTGEDSADTKTALYSASALGYVSEWDFEIETDDNISLRADEIVATASYGVGELVDLWGVELLVDNKN